MAYPIQPGHANLSKCWNWFRPEDQCRDRGEPSLIAGITRQIMKDYSVDRGRVYVAGLSAGGAAAAVLTVTYPDLYAAAGVHSGLAFGTAGDVVSAFAAMRGDCSKQYRPFAFAKEAVPTIVFHGENDRIVHPANAKEIVGSMKMMASRTDVHRGQVSGGRAYTCTSYITTDGQVVVEDWRIDGAGHAWSGGHPAVLTRTHMGRMQQRKCCVFFGDMSSRRAQSKPKSWSATDLSTGRFFNLYRLQKFGGARRLVDPNGVARRYFPAGDSHRNDGTFHKGEPFAPHRDGCL